MNNNGKRSDWFCEKKMFYVPKRKKWGEKKTYDYTKSGAQICGFCHKAEHVFEIAQKEEGQEGSKNTSPGKDIFKERIQSTV